MKRLIFSTLLLAIAPAILAQDLHKQQVQAADVIRKMMARDAERDAQSGGYSGVRHYMLENERLHKTAELVALVRCDRDGTKHFEVLSESGWSAANKHVLRKVIESEGEASRPVTRARLILSPDNYQFNLLGTELFDARLAYVIDVVPNRKDKYSMQGRVWIDAADFALVRAEGKLAHNPSVWTRSISFVQKYQKNGAFWFPVSTDSTTEVRLFGNTHVSILYSDYVPNIDSAFQQMSRKEMSYAIH